MTTLDTLDVFRIVHLDLAREPGHPHGSAEDRYTLILPLDEDGRIDKEYLRQFPDLCRVTHASAEGGVHRGLIRRESDGTWTFDYGDADRTVETGFRLGQERFVPGEYVSVIRNGKEHPYRVVSLQTI